MITNHTELLNALIEKHWLKSYLEIGVQNPANNFDKIKAMAKFGVDPAVRDRVDICEYTSDQYFEAYGQEGDKTVYDLIFIDGLHHADQVKRDFENSLRCLSDNGFIVIHDVLPENEAGTIVPRETKIWWGDVYKWAMQIKKYHGINFKTFDIDNGCMLVWKDATRNHELWLDRGNDWDAYLKYGKHEMNVTNGTDI